jgi:hypothetical protein
MYQGTGEEGKEENKKTGDMFQYPATNQVYLTPGNCRPTAMNLVCVPIKYEKICNGIHSVKFEVLALATVKIIMLTVFQNFGEACCLHLQNTRHRIS